MSTAGIFQLITNDGVQDRMLTATAMLNDRLAAISPNLPTLTDIEKTHILFVNAHFKPYAAVGYEYNVARPTGPVRWGSSVRFSIPSFGDFFHDMALHIVVDPLLPADSTPYSGSIGSLQNQVRWCEYPGEKIAKTTSFSVNNNPLDDYDRDEYIFYRQFTLPADKRRGWNRCMGQEEVWTGSLYHNPGSESFAEKKQFTSGFQTWKNSQDTMELYVPLLFWFNLNPALSIPSVCIPFGQRFIDIQISAFEELGQCINYLGLPATCKVPAISTCELVINNIFVNPEIHDIFIKQIGFYLIRVHKSQSVIADLNSAQILLNKFKFPVEQLFIGARRPETHYWHKFSDLTLRQKIMPVAFPPDPMAPGIPRLAYSTAEWLETAPILDTIELKSADISLFSGNTSMFDTYLPFARPGLITPDDSVYTINFNLYPGRYQPSGYLNFSRTRETYLRYTSSKIETVDRAEIVVHGTCINFLLVAEGSCALRYST